MSARLVMVQHPGSTEALNTATTCPSEHGDERGKERQGPGSGNWDNQSISCSGEDKTGAERSCGKTPWYRVAAFARSSAKRLEERGQTGGTVSETNMRLLRRPLGDALAQDRLIDSSHCRQF